MGSVYLVLDVESAGLHGDAVAWGAVVIDVDTQTVVAEDLQWIDPAQVQGTADGFLWLTEHCAFLYSTPTQPTPWALRESFWEFWERWRREGAQLVADCGWPVEARFLAACVADRSRERMWRGPYPLLDLGTLAVVTGRDPVGSYPRLPGEEPAHNPLCDARQSARLWCEWLAATR